MKQGSLKLDGVREKQKSQTLKKKKKKVKCCCLKKILGYCKEDLLFLMESEGLCS